jgi:hypothetical protein
MDEVDSGSEHNTYAPPELSEPAITRIRPFAILETVTLIR